MFFNDLLNKPVNTGYNISLIDAIITDEKMWKEATVGFSFGHCPDV
jgi:hypothetical protein